MNATEQVSETSLDGFPTQLGLLNICAHKFSTCKGVKSCCPCQPVSTDEQLLKQGVTEV